MALMLSMSLGACSHNSNNTTNTPSPTPNVKTVDVQKAKDQSAKVVADFLSWVTTAHDTTIPATDFAKQVSDMFPKNETKLNTEPTLDGFIAEIDKLESAKQDEILNKFKFDKSDLFDLDGLKTKGEKIAFNMLAQMLNSGLSVVGNNSEITVNKDLLKVEENKVIVPAQAISLASKDHKDNSPNKVFNMDIQTNDINGTYKIDAKKFMDDFKKQIDKHMKKS